MAAQASSEPKQATVKAKHPRSTPRDARANTALGIHVGQTVRHRHSRDTAIVAAICENEAGYWFYMNTLRGMPIGWWHQTDLALEPKTVPPMTVRGNGA